MTAALIFFVVSIIVGAAAISTFLWRRFAVEAPEPWERAASIAVLAFGVALAISWLLSWLHALERGSLLIAALACALPAAAYLARRTTFHRADHEIQNASLILFLVPLIIWIVFALWRGSIVPPLSHDALSYHLPKAVMMARAHQFEFFNAPDPRISTSPANYEMLLADVLLLTGSDDLTEWIGSAAYIAFLLLGAAVVERWWGNGPHVVVVIILLASVPVILLHTGAHKNDLLANVFYLAALLWAGRWLVTQETAPLLLALLSLAAGGGTKLQAAFLGAALSAVLVWVTARGRLTVSRTHVVIVVASIPAAVLLFGAWSYVANMSQTGHVALPASVSSDAGYGDWHNLWVVPLLLLMRPFDSSDQAVFVPWSGERWYWPQYELYFSDFGALLTILAITLPVAIWRWGRRWDSPRSHRERALTSIAAGIAFLLMLPIRIRPIGFFAGFPRYFVFIAAFVLAWSVAPLVRELVERGKKVVVNVILVVSALGFTATAIIYAVDDAFQPLSYVLYVAERPETRHPYFARYRAATVADIIAGPTDTIAIHAGFDSWIYPLYGRTLQRKVIFIEPDQPIPKEAEWVLVDRAWNTIWGHPRFEHTGQYAQYLGHGMHTGEDVAVLKTLLAQRDRYELVYYVGERVQAVFRRRDAEPRRQRSVGPTGGSSR